MSEENQAKCDRPIDAAVLADYWLALLPKREEEAIEEHFFSCDECGSRLGEIAALTSGVRQVTRDGSLLMVVSETFLKRAAAEGLRIREYAPIQPGGRVECTIAAEDDLLIGRVAADLTGAKQVDLRAYIRGQEQFRLVDIPVPAGESIVAFQMSSTYAKSAPSETMILRLVGYNEPGAEHVLGEYTFNHTRTIPGPAAW